MRKDAVDDLKRFYVYIDNESPPCSKRTTAARIIYFFKLHGIAYKLTVNMDSKLMPQDPKRIEK